MNHVIMANHIISLITSSTTDPCVLHDVHICCVTCVNILAMCKETV